MSFCLLLFNLIFSWGMYVLLLLSNACNVIASKYCEYVSVSKLKVQWSSIRSCFARELRLEKDSAKSGSGKRKRSIYKYTRNLDFLRPHMKLKALQENYNAPSNEEVNFNVLMTNRLTCLLKCHTLQLTVC